MSSPEIVELRVKALLSLAYVFMETAALDKALACIHSIEEYLAAYQARVLPGHGHRAQAMQVGAWQMQLSEHDLSHTCCT